ncbi:uncharacterized protein [Atheta coriaria]|uniref:uncharacterized protein isoform X4 n=2 Tax=Dalotia coriaria TaxID=877792 RepID=UPI0031F467A0
MAAENTLVFDFAGERHTEGQPFFHQIRANAMPKDNRAFTKFGRTPCRRTTVPSPNSGERHAGGQPFFHQIRANAMPEDNRSFTKFGRTQCRRITVLSPNCRDFAPDSNIVEGPFLQQIVIIKFHYLK